MLAEFENTVASFINANALFGPGEKILAAVSGGADSIGLMYVLHSLRSAKVFDIELVCAHINHRLRGFQADSDEAFVIEQAKKLNLPVTARRISVADFARKNKLSIETAARKLRIEALANIASSSNCNHIATGHHKNDNAETILHRLSRGTGFRGLGGIWPQKTITTGAGTISFVRPLLCVRRDQILQYLQRLNLEWCRDHTNYDSTYTRNYIRHKLLPALQADCKDLLIEQLADLAQKCRRLYTLLCSQVEEIWHDAVIENQPNRAALDLKVLSSQPEPIKVELARRALTAIGSGEQRLTAKHYERIIKLASAGHGRKITLPGGFQARRDYKNLAFEKTQEKFPPQQVRAAVTLKVPGKTKIGDFCIEAAVFEAKKCDFEAFKAQKSSLIEWFDLDKISPPLQIRFRQAGDHFRPLGLAGEKKVGKFLTCARVCQDLRQRLIIVADSEKIIWVAPVRISETAKITPQTKKILQLQLITGSRFC